jgi:hypothetical protein
MSQMRRHADRLDYDPTRHDHKRPCDSKLGPNLLSHLEPEQVLNLRVMGSIPTRLTAFFPFFPITPLDVSFLVLD